MLNTIRWILMLFWGVVPIVNATDYNARDDGIRPQLSSEQYKNAAPDLSWPQPTRQNRPWTRWWWLGSAVDKENLTELLSQYRQAGIGGVEICPIYGVKGYEARFIDFLSPEWMKMLEHTMQESRRLEIGVDLTTGTGWPFGGPMVTQETASAGVILKCYELKEGKLVDPLPKEPLHCLMAVSAEGRRMDISDNVKQDQLLWAAPPGKWKLYAVAMKTPLQKVKRAAPGAEGYVLDPYSVSALHAYLGVFDQAFSAYKGPGPRAYFHDSFEYSGATWTPAFFDEFTFRRGYDLRNYVEALSGEGPEDIVARVQCDYRHTLSDLHLDYIQHWTRWCHSKGSLSRNQAHGAPANLVDLYASADIPETEIYGRVDERQIPMLKFSSSAAHLRGNRLTSSESFTWLDEHFQTSLADLKGAADMLFLSGINHIFFHGIPYSPRESPWPGWQFYASVNFGPTGGLWHDLPAFNAYVTRCQSILQSGKPDQDVLLYFPIYDFWQKKDKHLMPFTVHNLDKWLYPTPFYHTAGALWNKGYTFDEVSDNFLREATCQNGKIVIGENEYEVVVVPHCRLIPVATMEKLLLLAREGATVLFEQALPEDVPGMGDLAGRRTALGKMLRTVSGLQEKNHTRENIMLGKGSLSVGNLITLLESMDVTRETIMDVGIYFLRRSHPEGFHYFLVNRSGDDFDGWITLGKPAQSIVLMDPLCENRTGRAALRQIHGNTQVYLQLKTGQACILRTFTDKMIDGPTWPYSQASGDAKTIQGTWSVEFIEGGPTLPQGYQTGQLVSWTARDNEETKRFSGTARYRIVFDRPAEEADDWVLDLGRVCESARVSLNGRFLRTLWSEPFQLPVGPYLSPGKNTLEVEVTNLAANRIRDMDRRGVNWKYFYDINIVNVDYQPLDAADWPVFDSGLLGPVRLQPRKNIALNDNRDNLPDKESEKIRTE
ncbi:MAG: hypothetical protein JW860_10480 [Sedimentisphaerales bacterium]|nr:hypothetical protein [Sedimentisphaerales bacterium]